MYSVRSCISTKLQGKEKHIRNLTTEDLSPSHMYKPTNTRTCTVYAHTHTILQKEEICLQKAHSNAPIYVINKKSWRIDTSIIMDIMESGTTHLKGQIKLGLLLSLVKMFRTYNYYGTCDRSKTIQ